MKIVEPTLHQQTPELQGKQCFCSYYEWKTKDTTNKQKQKSNKHITKTQIIKMLIIKTTTKHKEKQT